MTTSTTDSHVRFLSGWGALGLTLGIAGLVVWLAWRIEGVTMATRTATAMVMPIGAVWLGSLLLAWRSLGRRQWSAAMGFALIWLVLGITGNSLVATWMMNTVQWPEESLAATPAAPLRAAVVLGGGVMISPAGTPELGGDGERVFSAAQLWHAGLVSTIVCTGATPDGLHHPCDLGEELLLSTGVPPEVIFKVLGETTSGEMRALRAFFDAPPQGFPESGPVALITSAFHMPRAMRLAAAQELEFVPFPCAFRGTAWRGFEPSKLVPSASAAGEFGMALKEHLGGLVGR